MAKKQSLKAALRARTGSGKLNQMRREGWLPAVIYGHGTENQNLKVDAKAFSEMLARSSSENIVVNLDIEDIGARLAFLKAVHHAPLSGKPLHVDFLVIDENTEITANVPVHLVGVAVGVKAGGLLEVYLHMIEVVCLPGGLPEAVEIDVTHLDEGESLHISDVIFPEGVRPTHAPEVTIAHVGKQGSGEEGGEAAETAEALEPTAAAETAEAS